MLLKTIHSADDDYGDDDGDDDDGDGDGDDGDDEDEPFCINWPRMMD